jgi:hypothetical protein
VVGLLLAAGWALYGIAANDNKGFLAVMVVLSILLGGGTAVLVRPRDPS